MNVNKNVRDAIIAIAIIGTVCACGIGGLFMSARQSINFHEECQRQGGRVVDLGKDWICITPGGKVIPI